MLVLRVSLRCPAFLFERVCSLEVALPTQMLQTGRALTESQWTEYNLFNYIPIDDHKSWVQSFDIQQTNKQKQCGGGSRNHDIYKWLFLFLLVIQYTPAIISAALHVASGSQKECERLRDKGRRSKAFPAECSKPSLKQGTEGRNVPETQCAPASACNTFRA